MKSIVAFIILIGFLGCKKNDSNGNSYSQWQVTKVQGANTTTVNVPITLLVSWPSTSGCDVMDKFETTVQGNVWSIKSYGYTANQVCTQVAQVRTTNYTFPASATGTFLLQFYNPDNTYISDTITVH